ncbi:MAG: hypothetical protein HYU41_14790 [Candidatus Rokubacteria bacterium]|nr:hypothetical protein [Candidatus Rokubacteria bacterium]
MASNRGERRTERLRCDHCKKPILAPANVIAASDGLLFDSMRCKQRYLRLASLKALSNVVRVARSRLKARAIAKAEVAYRRLGGRDWPMVKMLLGAVL